MITHRFKSASLRQRSGMALMLVIPAVALAAVLAYAVLANTGTQGQISANSSTLAQTDCLAESGINYAMYNLQHPTLAPAFAGTYWPGTGGSAISLGGSSGKVAIAVQDYGAGEYSITSTATAASPLNITRTITACVQLTVPAVLPNQAVGFNGNFSLGSQTSLKMLVGNLISSGTVSLNSISYVAGSVIQNYSSTVSPAPSTVNSFATYQLNDVTYTATPLTTAPAAGTVLGPTTSPPNPAGIYYTSVTTFNLNGITINGTLIATNNVSVNGASNTITPAANFPALVVSKQIVISGAGKQLTANGVVWAKTGITGSGGTGSSITVNGALLIPTTPAIASGFNGTVMLNYVSKNVNVPNFSTTSQTPTSVKVVSWSQP